MKLKIATYNVENLFTRARVINLQDNDKAQGILEKVAKLQALLEETTYDHSAIDSLLKDEELWKYIDISEERGKLLNSDRRSIKKTVNGKKDWDGSIIFKRTTFSEQTRESTAKVIRELNADVLILVEVEHRIVLDMFNSSMLKSMYPYNMCIDGNDQRGIDVGVYSKFPIENIRSNIFLKDPAKKTRNIFSRDCLEVSVKLNDNTHLNILANHFLSKISENEEKRKRRKLQADTVADFLTSRYNLEKDLVVVAGDFNDTPDSKPLEKLLKLTHLADPLQLQFGPYEQNRKQRFTYKFGSQYNQIDFLLVSEPLKNGFKTAGVERRGMYGLGRDGITPFPTVNSPSTAGSDHGAVWADFEI